MYYNDITRFDFVGFDEIQSMSFVQPTQIQTALKDYMEFGEVQGFDASIVADAGIIVLGNIDASKFNVNENMMEEISPVFRESASLDRFHGFIPGWELPRMHQGLVANGWALNTEYFAEVLHLMRDDLSYSAIIIVRWRFSRKRKKSWDRKCSCYYWYGCCIEEKR